MSGRSHEGAQRAGIAHAKANDDRAHLGRKPSYTRAQFHMVRDLLAQAAVGIAAIASETGLGRQASTASRTTLRARGSRIGCLGNVRTPGARE